MNTKELIEKAEEYLNGRILDSGRPVQVAVQNPLTNYRYGRSDYIGSEEEIDMSVYEIRKVSGNTPSTPLINNIKQPWLSQAAKFFMQPPKSKMAQLPDANPLHRLRCEIEQFCAKGTT